MQKVRKLLPLLLCCAILLSFCACGAKPESNEGSNNDPASDPDKITDVNPGIQDSTQVNKDGVEGISEDAVLKAGIQGEPQMLRTYDGGNLGGVIDDAIYDTLIFFNSVTGEYEPCLATKWEIIDDCTTRYYLRDDVYTVNGTQITASDVVYTFREGQLNPSAQADFGYYDVDNFVIHDDFTIDIVTFEPFANAVIYLAQISFGIHCEKDAIAAGGMDALITNPVDTCGRYYFKEWLRGDRIILERNENYWGEPGYYKTIEVYFIADSTTRAFALQSGDVDVITYLNATQAEEMQSDPNLTIISQPAGTMIGMALNCSHPPFDNPKVREAIAYAINKDAILQIYSNGYGSTVDVLLPAANPLYTDIDASLKYSYNPEYAKQLLAEAGYGDGLVFGLILSNMYQRIAEIIQSNLADIGVTVEIDAREITGWFEVQNSGQYDANIAAWFPGNNIQPFYVMDGRVPFVAKGLSAIDSSAWNDTLDVLYGTADVEQGRVYSKELLEIAAKEVPIVALISSDYLFAANSNLTNFYCSTKCDMLHFDMLKPVG